MCLPRLTSACYRSGPYFDGRVVAIGIALRSSSPANVFSVPFLTPDQRTPLSRHESLNMRSDERQQAVEDDRTRARTRILRERLHVECADMIEQSATMLA